MTEGDILIATSDLHIRMHTYIPKQAKMSIHTQMQERGREGGNQFWFYGLLYAASPILQDFISCTSRFVFSGSLTAFLNYLEFSWQFDAAHNSYMSWHLPLNYISNFLKISKQVL